MKIAVFGAGAIGGLVGAKLARIGVDVTFIARGPHLAAMRQNGLTLTSEGETFNVRPLCTSDPNEAGPQDAIIVTVKAHSLPAAAPQIAAMLSPETTLITGINGIPYWYFYGLDSPWRDCAIQSVDPGGTLWRVLPPRQVLGAVVYPSAEVTEPGRIVHTYGNRFTLGEPDGTKSVRGLALSKLLTRAGLKAPLRPHIRDEIWVKLWGNLAFNPLSALTFSTLDRLAGAPDLRSVARTMMTEAEAVATSLGVKFPIDVDARIEGAAEVGAHKTSMLQDLERGRPIEIDALLGAVVELGEMTGKDMPMCRAILALTRERARLAGCYPSTSPPTGDDRL